MINLKIFMRNLFILTPLVKNEMMIFKKLSGFNLNHPLKLLSIPQNAILRNHWKNKSLQNILLIQENKVSNLAILTLFIPALEGFD